MESDEETLFQSHWARVDECRVYFEGLAHTDEYLRLSLEIYQPQCPHSTAEGRPERAQENTLTCTAMRLTLHAPTLRVAKEYHASVCVRAFVVFLLFYFNAVKIRWDVSATS